VAMRLILQHLAPYGDCQNSVLSYAVVSRKRKVGVDRSSGWASVTVY
jgi:hypothetical protein